MMSRRCRCRRWSPMCWLSDDDGRSAPTTSNDLSSFSFPASPLVNSLANTWTRMSMAMSADKTRGTYLVRLACKVRVDHELRERGQGCKRCELADAVRHAAARGEDEFQRLRRRGRTSKTRHDAIKLVRIERASDIDDAHGTAGDVRAHAVRRATIPLELRDQFRAGRVQRHKRKLDAFQPGAAAEERMQVLWDRYDEVFEREAFPSARDKRQQGLVRVERPQVRRGEDERNECVGLFLVLHGGLLADDKL